VAVAARLRQRIRSGLSFLLLHALLKLSGKPQCCYENPLLLHKHAYTCINLFAYLCIVCVYDCKHMRSHTHTHTRTRTRTCTHAHNKHAFTQTHSIPWHHYASALEDFSSVNFEKTFDWDEPERSCVCCTCCCNGSWVWVWVLFRTRSTSPASLALDWVWVWVWVWVIWSISAPFTRGGLVVGDQVTVTFGLLRMRQRRGEPTGEELREFCRSECDAFIARRGEPIGDEETGSWIFWCNDSKCDALFARRGEPIPGGADSWEWVCPGGCDALCLGGWGEPGSYSDSDSDLWLLLCIDRFLFGLGALFGGESDVRGEAAALVVGWGGSGTFLPKCNRAFIVWVLASKSSCGLTCDKWYLFIYVYYVFIWMYMYVQRYIHSLKSSCGLTCNKWCNHTLQQVVPVFICIMRSFECMYVCICMYVCVCKLSMFSCQKLCLFMRMYLCVYLCMYVCSSYL
jgi:hypothetical protein